MSYALTYRKAKISDLRAIVTLLLEDELGQAREHLSQELDARYLNAFKAIDADPNQYLMVVNLNQEVVGTCHLTIIPSLTFIGSTRMQIEAVRVSTAHRGRKVGQGMIQEAIEYGRVRGASIIQLTTSKKRSRAKQFYEGLGFKATHEGMKYHLKNNG